MYDGVSPNKAGCTGLTGVSNRRALRLKGEMQWSTEITLVLLMRRGRSVSCGVAALYGVGGEV